MFFLVHLILLSVVLLIVKFLYKCYDETKYLSKIPGPPALPVIGHALFLNESPNGLWKKHRQLLADYYPISALWGFTMSGVVIQHPDDFQVLIKSKTNLNKAELLYSYFSRYGLDGVPFSDAKKWHERRTILQQGFSHNNFTKSIVENTNKYGELIIQEMLDWDDESIQDVLPTAFKFAFNVISNSVMSCDWYTLGKQQSEDFINSFKNVVRLLIFRSVRPYLRDWMIKFSPIGREINRNREIAKAFLKKVIEERRNYYKTNGINLFSDDVIDHLKNIRNDENTKDKPLNKLDIIDTLLINNAKGLIDEAGVYEELEVLIAAGYDTTAYAISYTLLLLAENENEQNLARKEVIDIMNKNGSKFTSSNIQNLKYLDLCIKESMRLFPSVPLIGRKLVEDTKFNNYLIPRNKDIIASVYDLHRNPNFWTEPEKFIPDRFLPEFSKDRHPYAYLPFSGGPRACMGQKQAMTEIKTMVAHTLYNFYLKPVYFTRDLTFNADAILYPTEGKLRVKFIKIKK